MIEAIVLLGLAGFYFFTEGSETSYQEAIFAIGFCSFYLMLYHLIEPMPPTKSTRLGQLYSFLPMLSLAVILFPHFNNNAQEVVTKTLGWFGLIITFIILSYFKLRVW